MHNDNSKPDGLDLSASSLFLSLIGHDILEEDLQTVQIESKVGPARALFLSTETKHARQRQQARRSRFISFFIVMMRR